MISENKPNFAAWAAIYGVGAHCLEHPFDRLKVTSYAFPMTRALHIIKKGQFGWQM